MKILSHAIVWIDHTQARVLLFDRDDASTRVIHPESGTPHLHHKSNSIGSGHNAEDQHYLHAVGQAIKDASAVLVAGPANAKLELIKHLTRHDKGLAGRVVGVETLDHPTDGQLLDHARRYFALADQSLPQRAGGA
jgi:stalled ribosome rescue protein Dom34